MIIQLIIIKKLLINKLSDDKINKMIASVVENKYQKILI